MMPRVKRQKLHMASHQLLQHQLPPHGLVHLLQAQLPLHGPEQPQLLLHGPEQPQLLLHGLVHPLLYLVPLLLLYGLGHPQRAHLALLHLHGLGLPQVGQTCPTLEVQSLLPLPQELQASFPACHLPQADTPHALGCQDSFPLHQVSFLECTPLLQGLLRLPTPTCPTKGTCMAREAPPLFLLPQGFLEECFHLCPLAHGDRLQDRMEAPLHLEECW
ncbi:uncharacterized [Tachysurus ichikawai]